MNLAPILRLLEQRTGLDSATLGDRAVQAVLGERLRELDWGAERYAAQLEADPAEFSRLVGQLVVPETWFFRGGELFSFLAEQIRAMTTSRPDRVVRVLSLPCSTGEEPYSLAIALAELGIAPGRRYLLGVDLSSRNIEAAQRGRYRDFSFRQTTPDLRQRYFRQHDDGWELDPALRATVHFQVGNLLSSSLLIGEPPFDIVFCRNLFIYFGPEARAQGMDALVRLLAPAGWLAVGHAEPVDARDARFTRSGPDHCFLYRRTEAPALRPQVSRSRALVPLPPRVTALQPRPARPARPNLGPARTPPPAPVPASAPPASPTASLARARSLADQGRIDDALQTCRQAEAQLGPSADLFALLGILHQARRENDTATSYFTKALYLDPNHRESLHHLLLLHQHQGAGDRAAVLRARLDRLPPQGDDA